MENSRALVPMLLSQVPKSILRAVQLAAESGESAEKKAIKVEVAEPDGTTSEYFVLFKDEMFTYQTSTGQTCIANLYAEAPKIQVLRVALFIQNRVAKFEHSPFVLPMEGVVLNRVQVLTASQRLEALALSCFSLQRDAKEAEKRLLQRAKEMYDREIELVKENSLFQLVNEFYKFF